MNGPVAVMMEVSLSSTPVLKRAGVNDRGALVSNWNCATWLGDRARRRGWGLLSLGKPRSKPVLPSFLPSCCIESMSRRYVRHVARTQEPSADTSRPMMGSPRAGIAVFARRPNLSKRRMSPLSDATAMKPFSVVAAVENLFLLVYCLYSESTSLLPERRGSTR